MADDTNKELMEFLQQQFEGINKRLDNTATKDDLKIEIAAVRSELSDFATKDDLANLATKDDIEEVKRHTGILFEDVNHKLDLLVEGFKGINESRAVDKEENKREHGRLEKIALINTADIATLDKRVGRLEGKA